MNGQLLSWLRLNKIGEIFKNLGLFFGRPYWLNSMKIRLGMVLWLHAQKNRIGRQVGFFCPFFVIISFSTVYKVYETLEQNLVKFKHSSHELRS